MSLYTYEMSIYGASPTYDRQSRVAQHTQLIAPKNGQSVICSVCGRETRTPVVRNNEYHCKGCAK